MSLLECRRVDNTSHGHVHAAAGLWFGSGATENVPVVGTSLGAMMPTRGLAARSNLCRQVAKMSGPNIAASSLPVWMSIIILFAQTSHCARERVRLGSV